MGNDAAGGFSAKRRIVLPLLLLLLHNYLELAIGSNNSPTKKEVEYINKVDKKETEALLNLFNNTKQKLEVNWSRDTPTCEWIGVGCDQHGEHVTILSLPGKSLTGYIPSNSIGSLTKLKKLTLMLNNLEGNIPSDFKNLEYLRYLNLGSNKFSGEFPPEITQLQNLEVIDISENRFSGSILSDFSNLTKLQILNLSSNAFSGEILHKITMLRNLKIIDFSENRFSGEISSAITNLTDLRILNLRSNAFSGDLITSKIAELRSLKIIVLSRNRFSGKIPCGLQYLPELRQLRLENNTFTGKIPAIHIGRSVYFSVAYNNLTGAVPDTLSLFRNESFVGNPLLCNPPLTTLCKYTKSNMSRNSLRDYCPSQPSLRTPATVNFVMSGGGALFLLLFLIILLFPVPRNHRPSPTTTTLSIDQQKSDLFIFPENNNIIPSWAKGLDVTGIMSGGAEEMKSRSLRLKGNNSTWTSYKVELTLTDKVIVVKKSLDPHAVVFDRQYFAKKMNFLGKKIQSHPNVMPLRGYCIYKELRYLLIYDFFPAGSLYHRLHESTTELVLKWDSRKRIALGAARGLTHLHTVVELVHGNIKSSNILLYTPDENNDPVDSCVADFGLTPTPPTSYYHVPPPLEWWPDFSFESDVYAFGVLLLELLTGKSPEALDYINRIPLPEWVQSIIFSTSHDEIWDSKMCMCHEEMKMVESEMVCLLQIAERCTHQEANERPKMDKVARMIEDLNVNCRTADHAVDQDVIHEIFQADNSLN